MNKIVLFLMTEKGFEIVKFMILNYRDMIDLVVVGQDKNISNDYSNEIIEVCKENRVEWSYKDNNRKINDDFFIFAISWRWMIHHREDRLIVFHDSLLPKYRGFSPLVNMLINGEETIGVSALLGGKSYDSGDIIAQVSSNITYPIKIAKAIQINNVNYLNLVTIVVNQIKENNIMSEAQCDEDVTYSVWRDSLDYFIDWNQSSEEIKRFVDAVGEPYSGAKTRVDNNKMLLIDEVEVIDDVICELRHVGKVLFLEEGFPCVICGVGMLKILSAREMREMEAENCMSFFPLKKFRYRLY